MKLSTAQIAAVEQATGANPLPEDNPAQAQLSEALGDHTFYLDQQGLVVLENPESAASEDTLEIVRVGQWTDDERQQLGLTPPQRTGQVIELADYRKPAPGDDGAA